MAQKYYAVVVGRTIGIFKSFSEYDKQTRNYSGAVSKTFYDINSAKQYLLDFGVREQDIHLYSKVDDSQKCFYAVARGRKLGIFQSWNDCKQSVNKYSKAKFKAFSDYEKAEAYLIKAGVKKKNIKLYDAFEREPVHKNCVLCMKPMTRKSDLCMSCKRKKKDLEEFLFYLSGGKFQRISTMDLYNIQTRSNTDDVFNLIEAHPNLLFSTREIPRKTRMDNIREYKADLRKKTELPQSEEIPAFIRELFGEDKIPLKAYGDKFNPTIEYYCKRCHETLMVQYLDYKKHQGHDCSAIMSSGEAIVEDFLKRNNIPYKTQRKTLRCINPETGFVLPYDFELTGKNILIEVQGNQHRQFVPVFHITEEGFEYQKKKDEFKRIFAVSRGYTLIEIWYEDLNEKRLQELIL